MDICWEQDGESHYDRCRGVAVGIARLTISAFPSRPADTLLQVLVGILRHNVTQLLDGPPKKQSKAVVREQSVILLVLSLQGDRELTIPSLRLPRRALQRSRLLSTSSPACPLPPLTFQALASHLSLAFQAGDYLKVKPSFDKDGNMIEPEKAAPPNPLTDPSAMDGMMEGMKKQVVMMVPNFAIMAWVGSLAGCLDVAWDAD